MSIFSKKKSEFPVETLHQLCGRADSLKPTMMRTIEQVRLLLSEIKSHPSLFYYVKRVVVPKLMAKATAQDIAGCFEILGEDPVVGPVLNSVASQFNTPGPVPSEEI